VKRNATHPGTEQGIGVRRCAARSSELCRALGGLLARLRLKSRASRLRCLPRPALFGDEVHEADDNDHTSGGGVGDGGLRIPCAHDGTERHRDEDSFRTPGGYARAAGRHVRSDLQSAASARARTGSSAGTSTFVATRAAVPVHAGRSVWSDAVRSADGIHVPGRNSARPARWRSDVRSANSTGRLSSGHAPGPERHDRLRA
jgi:hypothetical protein